MTSTFIWEVKSARAALNAGERPTILCERLLELCTVLWHVVRRADHITVHPVAAHREFVEPAALHRVVGVVLSITPSSQLPGCSR